MTTTKKIYIGSDHAGFKLKGKIEAWLIKNRVTYEDLGNTAYDPSDDYPDYAFKVAKKAVKNKSLGVLICGSAQGMCIAANKIKGARAVVPFSIKEARLAKEHNNANIICLSGWYIPYHKTTKMLEKFLTTQFTKEKRHLRRLNKIKSMEK